MRAGKKLEVPIVGHVLTLHSGDEVLTVGSVDLFDDGILVGIVLLSVGKDGLDQSVKVGIRSQRPLGHQFLSARRAFFVA